MKSKILLIGGICTLMSLAPAHAMEAPGDDTTLTVLKELTCWDIGGQSFDGQKQFGPNTYALKTMPSSIWYNRAFAYPTTTEADVDAVLGFYGDGAFSWWVADDQTEVKELLERKGFEKNQNEYMMEFIFPNQEAKNEEKNDEQADEKTEEAPKITVKQVNNLNDLDIWMDTSAKGFGLSVDEVKKFANDYVLRFGKIDQTSLLIAFLDDKPVSTGMLILHTNTAPFATTIHLVSTIEPYRKEGLATAIMSQFVETAYIYSCTGPVMLFSSGMAHKWYQETQFCPFKNTGFSDVKTYEIYTKKEKASGWFW